MSEGKSGSQPYIYILPAVILMTVLSLLPNLYSLFIAFTNFSLFHYQDFSFVGLHNFKKIVAGPEFHTFVRVFAWTLVWAVLSVVLSLGTGLALALPLNVPELKGANIYRTLFIVPWAIPIFISVLMPLACTSSAPRKMNGKPSTWLIWFG